MFPPYCCWLVGVCAVPGNDGPQRAGGVPEPGRLARAAPAARRSGGKAHAVNHNVLKAAPRAAHGRVFLHSPVTRFAHDDDRAALPDRTIAQQSDRRSQRVI